MVEPFFGDFDLAQLALYLFWLFFAGLIYYLQTENMREGYPLEDDDGNPAGNQGPFPVPDPKTFNLPHGRGKVTVPDMKPENRELALQRGTSAGAPHSPTGDPMADGVGPASWAPRRDEPELDGHGHPKIVPMAIKPEFFVNGGRDARGMPVVSADKQVVGTVTDLWIDFPEQLVRYLQFDLASGKGTRLVPITLVRIKSDHVMVKSLFAAQFDGVPAMASTEQITKLEEEKICAYYCGGTLYAHPSRAEPLL